MTMTTTTTTARRSPVDTLGVDTRGLTTVDEILAAAGANFTAVTATPSSTFVGEDGLPFSVPIEAVAIHRDDTFAALGVHKPGYGVVQHRYVVETALDIVGLTAGDGRVTAAGALDGGAKFFVSIDFGSLTLDPGGVADVIEDKLIGWNSLDGTIPVIFTPDALRVICMNVLPSVRRSARERGFMARHTKNVHDRLTLAKNALGIHEKARELFIAQAEQMLRIPANHDTLNRVANKMWPLDPEASDSAKTRSKNRLDTIHRLFDAPTNVPAVGANAWAVYNALTEYLDHGRGTSVEKRAMASLTPGTWVETRKVEAARLCLAI